MYFILHIMFYIYYVYIYANIDTQASELHARQALCTDGTWSEAWLQAARLCTEVLFGAPRDHINVRICALLVV